MGRPNYVCPVCTEHFTRKYSAKRHNSNIHNGSAEIVPFMEYMAGRSSGRFEASHPARYRKERELQGIGSYQNNIESRIVADLGSSFRPENLQRSLPPYTSSYAMTLVQQTQKMEELIKLVERHNTPQTAHKIIEYTKMRLREGDDGFLNDKLKRLRMLDEMSKRA